MKEVNFITKHKPEDSSVKWKSDEVIEDYYYIESDVEDYFNLIKGNRVIIGGYSFEVVEVVFDFDDYIMCYHLEPIYRLNI